MESVMAEPHSIGAFGSATYTYERRMAGATSSGRYRFTCRIHEAVAPAEISAAWYLTLFMHIHCNYLNYRLILFGAMDIAQARRFMKQIAEWRSRSLPTVARSSR
jgi:hypothetical protein